MLSFDASEATPQRPYDAGCDCSTTKKHAEQQCDQQRDAKSRGNLRTAKINDGGLTIERTHDRTEGDAGKGNQQSDHMHDGLPAAQSSST